MEVTAVICVKYSSLLPTSTVIIWTN